MVPFEFLLSESSSPDRSAPAAWIGDDAPWFAGHFPDRPILPAIAQIAGLVQAVRLGVGADRTLAGLPTLRFLSRVTPGATLHFHCEVQDERGLAGFSIRQASGWVSRGKALWRDPLTATAENRIDDDSVVAPWEGGFDADALLPHDAPAHWIRSVRSESSEQLDGLACIPTESPFVSDGFAPSFVALEIAAQAAAALEALGRRGVSAERDLARQGYIVSARNVEFSVDSIPAETAIRVHIRLQGQAMPLSLYSFRIAVGGVESASGSIGTYLAT